MTHGFSAGPQPLHICLMSRVLEDVAVGLYHGLEALGHTVYFGEGKIVNGCRNIVVGAHLIDDPAVLPADSVIVNLEQLGAGSMVITPAYLAALQAYPVWDYSLRNIEWLRQRGARASLIRLGYVPALRRVMQALPDIDVLFYGALNDRRNAVLDQIRQRGLNLVALSHAYGRDLDSYIGRSKVVLNLHYYETKIFEIVRVSYLLNNRKTVVAEVGDDTEIEADIRSAVVGVPYDGLAQACADMVADDARRAQHEHLADALYMARRQPALLAGAAATLA